MVAVAQESKGAVAMVCGHRASPSGTVCNFGSQAGAKQLCPTPENPQFTTVHACLLNGNPFYHVGGLTYHIGSVDEGSSLSESQAEQQQAGQQQAGQQQAGQQQAGQQQAGQQQAGQQQAGQQSEHQQRPEEAAGPSRAAAPGLTSLYTPEFLGVSEIVPGACSVSGPERLGDEGDLGVGQLREGGVGLMMQGHTVQDSTAICSLELADYIWQRLGWGINRSRRSMTEPALSFEELFQKLNQLPAGFMQSNLLPFVEDIQGLKEFLINRHGDSAGKSLLSCLCGCDVDTEVPRGVISGYVIGAQWWVGAWLWDLLKPEGPKLWPCHWSVWLSKAAKALKEGQHGSMGQQAEGEEQHLQQQRVEQQQQLGQEHLHEEEAEKEKAGEEWECEAYVLGGCYIWVYEHTKVLAASGTGLSIRLQISDMQITWSRCKKARNYCEQRM